MSTPPETVQFEYLFEVFPKARRKGGKNGRTNFGLLSRAEWNKGTVEIAYARRRISLKMQGP